MALALLLQNHSEYFQSYRPLYELLERLCNGQIAACLGSIYRSLEPKEFDEERKEKRKKVRPMGHRSYIGARGIVGGPLVVHRNGGQWIRLVNRGTHISVERRVFVLRP